MMLQAIRRHVKVPGLLAALALSVAAMLTLSIGVARAEVPKLVSNGVIHSEGSDGVAVDQVSGDVFATGFLGLTEEGSLRTGEHSGKFDASGSVLSPPSPFDEGLRYGAAVDPTNGHLYVASASGEIEVYDSNTGTLLSSFGVPPFFCGFHRSGQKRRADSDRFGRRRVCAKRA